MAFNAPPVSGNRWLTAGESVAERAAIKWDSLEGQVVLVVFWSFGCEASLLQLRQVQNLVADVNSRATKSGPSAESDVVAIAVHSPRFPFEDDEERLQAAVAMQRLTLPVVHDPEHITWNRYNPGGWPATVVVGRDQKTIGLQCGTNGSESLRAAVELATTAPRPKPKMTLRRPTIQLAEQSCRIREQESEDKSDTKAASRRTSLGKQSGRSSARSGDHLLYPSAVAALPSGLMAIADTGNNRVLIGGLDSERRTLKPQLEVTQIDAPIGVVLRNESELYVIERGSASVIGIDLATGATTTVARDFVSPTALCLDKDGSVVVADAGAEQLLRIVVARPGEILVGTIAGSGATGFDDGVADRAKLAQPVAVARASNGIVFCDAASSNVRLLTNNGTVQSATSNDFFEWGLVDGPVHRAKLQRPSGLATLDDGSIVVADTGNNRLRILQNQRLTTLGLVGLDHPLGLATVSDNLVALADSGNDRILLVSPSTQQAWPVNIAASTETVVHVGSVRASAKIPAPCVAD